MVMFLALGVLVAALALVGARTWALAALGVLLGIIAIVAQLQLIAIRASLRQQQGATRANGRAVRRAAVRAANSAQAISAGLSSTQRSVAALQADLADVQSATASAVARTQEQLAERIAAPRSDIGGVARQLRRLQPELMTEIQALTQLIQRYAPTARLPLVAGWALSPAGLLYLADSIEARGADFVVECGSGTSTLWMALAMRRKGSGKVIAIEHLEEYADRTRTVLEAHGVSEWAEVRVCPLTDVTTPRGDFQWYDLDPASLDQPIDILLVDGPPATTGSHARYPALPQLRSRLSRRGIVVVDDADRADEREMIDFWVEEMPSLTQVDSPGHGVRVLVERALA